MATRSSINVVCEKDSGHKVSHNTSVMKSEEACEEHLEFYYVSFFTENVNIDDI